MNDTVLQMILFGLLTVCVALGVIDGHKQSKAIDELDEDMEEVFDALSNAAAAIAMLDKKVDAMDERLRMVERLVHETADRTEAQNGLLTEKVEWLEAEKEQAFHEIEGLKAQMEQLPIEQMQANAKAEEAFYQGVQNIMDYSAENISRLNIGGIVNE